jgi:hypothetical protein
MARTRKADEQGPFTHNGAASALKGRWGEGAKRKESLKADWSQIDPTIVHSLVSGVGALGGACTLGVDKNGAGFTVAVWMGGEKVFNQWYRGDFEGQEALHAEIEAFTQDVQALIRAS